MTTAPESINIHTDSPINDLREDKFGRASLVELLAKSIQTKCESEHDSLCIGIYGKWGEGKTSFVNMLKQKIKLDNPTLSKAIVDFNPWIINEEKGLIKDFFKTIAGNAEGKLKEFIAKYGGIIAYSAQIVGNVVAPGLGASFKKHVKELNKYILKASETSIEQQKEDISKELVGSNKHLIVFIDDIDRLDCDEIHAVFRLVRQVADFKNTIYVLSLDEERVAKSIGKYFGEGCESDGRQFLEKIVQIPIVLPQIQKNDLKRLLRAHLVEVFNSCKLEVLEVSEILNKIYPLFETYREIIRYRNQLQFFFPDVHTEVNHHDYFIIEAIKTLNPKAYNLIKNKGPYLLKKQSFGSSGDLENEYSKLVDEIVKLFIPSKREKVHSIMTDLIDLSRSNGQRTRAKRLCSEIYFDRYFLQSVPYDVISDKCVDSLDSSDINAIKDWIHSKEGFYSDTEIIRSLFYMLDRRSLVSFYKTNIYIALSTSPIVNRDAFASLSDELANTQLKSVKDDDFERFVKSVFFKARLDFCMALLGNMVSRDIARITRHGFEILQNRLLEKSQLEVFAYPQFTYVRFFELWRKYDKTQFVKFIQNSFNHPDFDVNKFIGDNLTSEDDHGIINEIDSLIKNYGKTLQTLIGKIPSSTESKKHKLLIFNYQNVLKTYKMRNVDDIMYC